jgi:hypothetical protein
MRFSFTPGMPAPAINIRSIFYGGASCAAILAVRCRGTAAIWMSALLCGFGGHFWIPPDGFLKSELFQSPRVVSAGSPIRYDAARTD